MIQNACFIRLSSNFLDSPGGLVRFISQNELDITVNEKNTITLLTKDLLNA